MSDTFTIFAESENGLVYLPVTKGILDDDGARAVAAAKLASLAPRAKYYILPEMCGEEDFRLAKDAGLLKPFAV